MARVQVQYTHKQGIHYNPHERIQGLAGDAGGGWYRTEASVIADIKARLNSYFVTAEGRTAEVVLAIHNGRTYVKTVADGYSPDNLLALPEPPRHLLP